jgi:FecR-like protein
VILGLARGRNAVYQPAIVVALALAVVGLQCPTALAAEPTPAGVVTTLEGAVTVTRANRPPAELRFRDDVFVRDRISAGDRSLARILFGGRAVVTVAERSVVTITETVGASTIDLTAGKIALAVVKERMKPGDRIDVRTPNGIAGIRGTVIVAEVDRVRTDLGDVPQAFKSRFTVLRGLVEVTALDVQSRLPTGNPIWVSALQSVTLDAVSAPQRQSITPEAARRFDEPFKVAPRDASSVVRSAATDVQYREAAADAEAVARTIGSRDSSTKDATTNKESTPNDRSGGQDHTAAETKSLGVDPKGAAEKVDVKVPTAVAVPSVAPAPAVALPSVGPGPTVALPSVGPAPTVALPSVAPTPTVAVPSLAPPATTVAVPSLVPPLLRSLVPVIRH